MAEITVIISENGETKITVSGVEGSSCVDLTRKLELALGKAENRYLTSEYTQIKLLNTSNQKL